MTAAHPNNQQKKEATAIRNAAVVQAREAGATYQQLAEQFSLSRARICQILGTRKPETAERNQRIGEMYAAGTPVEQIATQFGISPCSVSHIVGPWRGQRRKPKTGRNQHVGQLYATGVPVNEIAAQCGIPRYLVDSIIQRVDGKNDWRERRAAALKERDQRTIQEYATDAASITRSERNQRIIKMREAGLTLQQVADCFRLTRERVRQIEATQDTPKP